MHLKYNCPPWDLVSQNYNLRAWISSKTKVHINFEYKSKLDLMKVHTQKNPKMNSIIKEIAVSK